MRLADGGTLFLDEIGDMTALAQSKMLRALEQREVQPLGAPRPIPVDIRLITATNRDLETLVAAGKFRQTFTGDVTVFTSPATGRGMGHSLRLNALHPRDE